MKGLRASTAIGVSLLLLTLLPATSAGQEYINRRAQALDAFQASPAGIYGHYCAHCHGDDGTGGGRLWATELSPAPTDLTALEVDRDYLLEAIRNGSAAHGKSNLCPPWGRTISAFDVQRLALYLLELRANTPPMQELSMADPGAGHQPFPWLLTLVIVAEIALLWWTLRTRKKASDKELSNVLP